MKIVTEIKEINELLHSYVGGRLQIAFYSESLKRIAIRIWLPNMENVIYVIGVSCLSMRGSFYLSNVNLSINKEMSEGTKENIIKISDKILDFEVLTSGGIILALGLESEFGTSFDDFIIY